MLILNNPTTARSANATAPPIAERLAARPHPGDVPTVLRPADLDRLLTEFDAAKILDLRPAPLGYWRSRGSGHRFLRRGCKHRCPIRYRPADVLKFRAARATHLEAGS